MKRDTIVAILATFCLTAALFMVSSSLGYDPWADTNDDGKIDMKDIGYEARLFGTSGNPAKPVAIEGYNWTAPSYSVDIPAGQTQSVHVVTAGYRQITLGLDANASGLHVGEIQAAAGFLLGDRYVGVDRFNITVESDGEPHPGNNNSMWIEPSVSVIPTVIGYRFNLTVWVNITQQSVGWEFQIGFDGSAFNYSRGGYTAGSKSEFYSEHSTIPVAVTTGEDYVWYAEALFPPDKREPGVGSLAWLEFELIAIPAETQFKLGEGPGVTRVIDAINQSIVNLQLDLYNSTIQLGPFTLPEHSLIRTYIVTGPLLTIACYNPNDFDVTLKVEVYLTA